MATPCVTVEANTPSFILTIPAMIPSQAVKASTPQPAPETVADRNIWLKENSRPDSIATFGGLTVNSIYP